MNSTDLTTSYCQTVRTVIRYAIVGYTIYVAGRIQCHIACAGCYKTDRKVAL